MPYLHWLTREEDLRPLLSPAALAAGRRLPEPSRHKGGEYFEPFAGELLGALQELGRDKIAAQQS